MADKEYKSHNGILGSRLIQERELTLVDKETGESVGTFTAKRGSNALHWKDPAGDGTQLKFNIQDDGILDITDDDLTIDFMSSDPDYDGLTPIWLYADPVIFDEETKAEFLKLPISERPRFATYQIEKFYQEHIEYDIFARRTIYSQPEELLKLFKSLTPGDFETCKIGNAEQRYNELQERIARAEKRVEELPINADNLATIWPILSIREMFLESEIAEFYYLKNPHKSAREQALEQGAIMTTGGRLADISNKDYSGWLDEVPNGAAYLSYVGAHYWDNIEIDDGGNIYEGDEARVIRSVRSQDGKIIKALEAGTFDDGRPPEHGRINKEVLRALLNATIEENGAYRTIYLPKFAHELNANYRVDIDEYDERGELNEKGKETAKRAAEARANNSKMVTEAKPSIMQQFYSLDYWVGVINGDTPKRTAIITSINKEAKTIEVVLPYIDAIKKQLEEAQEIEAINHHRAYILPAYNFLVHSNMDAERNKLAVDLVYTIIDKLLRRGSKPASEFKENQQENEEKKNGEKVVYRVKYSTLIKDTPLLSMAYKNADGSKREYDVLNRTFKRAFTLLKKKTDIYDYFLDLNIPETPPTKRTIDDNLIITHKGKNPAYKKK